MIPSGAGEGAWTEDTLAVPGQNGGVLGRTPACVCTSRAWKSVYTQYSIEGKHVGAWFKSQPLHLLAREPEQVTELCASVSSSVHWG